MHSLIASLVPYDLTPTMPPNGSTAFRFPSCSATKLPGHMHACEANSASMICA